MQAGMGIEPAGERGASTTLKVHIEYGPYLTARTTSRIVAGFDDVYETLSMAESFTRYGFQRAARSRLRLEEAHTGRSIDLLFANGLTQGLQDLQTGGTLVVGGMLAMSAMAKTLIGVYRELNSARMDKDLGEAQVRSEDARAEIEVQRARASAIAVDDLERRAEYREAIRRGVQELGLPPAPSDDLTRQVMRPLATLDAALRSPEILSVSIDDTVVVGQERPPVVTLPAEDATADPKD